jgi:outer membrane lipopolysaccharide assembly protein LptE/RlpB
LWFKGCLKITHFTQFLCCQKNLILKIRCVFLKGKFFFRLELEQTKQFSNSLFERLFPMDTNMLGNKYFRCFLIGLCLTNGILMACGYQLAGSGRLPKGIRRVFVAEPVNRTSDARLISVLSDDLKSELTNRQVRLSNSPNDADGILTSEIVSISDATIARRGETTALEKRLIIHMDVKLESQDGQALWVGKKISADEAYTVINGDDIATDNNRRIAIDELSKRLAEDIYQRLTADF